MTEKRLFDIIDETSPNQVEIVLKRYGNHIVCLYHFGPLFQHMPYQVLQVTDDQATKVYNYCHYHIIRCEVRREL